jgi:hypothetical protein
VFPTAYNAHAAAIFSATSSKYHQRAKQICQAEEDTSYAAHAQLLMIWTSHPETSSKDILRRFKKWVKHATINYFW